MSPPPHPERLLQQADMLAVPQGGEPDQTDLRRAISAAYYAVFHFLMTTAADLVIGSDKRSTAQYALAYRSVDHMRLKTVCTQLRGQVPDNVRPYAPAHGFGEIADFARLAGNLVELRNLSDYDPSQEFTLDAVRTAIGEARKAIQHFQAADAEQREAFLILLLFRPRDPTLASRPAQR